MTPLERLERNYLAAFLRYLPNRDESALHAGYKIGRSSVADELSILDLVQIHHGVLLDLLRDGQHTDREAVISAASEFLVEVLATYEMAQRGFREEL